MKFMPLILCIIPNLQEIIFSQNQTGGKKKATGGKQGTDAEAQPKA